MVVRIFEDYARGDVEAARVAQDRLYELVVAVRAGVFPLAIKAAMHMMGICEPWSAPPTRQLDERLAGPLREALAANGLLTPERSRY
jgi:dihydrodipicolinate synthase/N-acetylneuraminate lyase